MGLLFNYSKLGAVLWAICEENATTQGVSRDDFMDAMDGEALIKGWEAIVDAIVFFIQSQSPKMAAAVKESIEAELRVLEAGAEAMFRTIKSQATDEGLKQAIATLEATMQREVSQSLADSVGS